MSNVSSFFYFRSSRGRGGFGRGGFSKPIISSFDEPKTENGSFESPPQGKFFYKSSNHNKRFLLNQRKLRKQISFKQRVLTLTVSRVSGWKLFLEKNLQITKFFVKDFFSKCDQIRWKLRIWSKKSLMENFIFCGVIGFYFFCYRIVGLG